MGNYKTIEIQISDKVAILKFNRPEQLNAMNRQMMDEIIEGIHEINANDDCNVALITGSGRAFMAGADIKEYASQTPEEFVAFQEKGKQLYQAIEHAPKPWIAAVNGFALGGGFEIALSCDMIVAAEDAKMGLPEVFLSLIPGGGGTQRLIQKIGINRVKEMLFLGGQYSANTLYDWGVVNRVFSNEQFQSEAFDFASKVTRRSKSALTQLKRLAHLSMTPIDFDIKINDEADTVKTLFLNEEAHNAIQQFIKKSEKNGK